MSQNRYARTHSYSMSETYGLSADFSNGNDDDDIELDDEFYSDGYDDDLQGNSSISRNSLELDSSQCVRREHHNKLEQKRRAFIRDSYTDLKDVMPEYKGKKLSRANILIYTRQKVQELRKTKDDLKRQFESKKSENDREERDVQNSERQLDSLENNSMFNQSSNEASSLPPLSHLTSSNGHQRQILITTHQSRNLAAPSIPSVASLNQNNLDRGFRNSCPIELGNDSNSDVGMNSNSLSNGASSNGDTPSACSLTDSPVNSAISSSLSSNIGILPSLAAAHFNLERSAQSIDMVDGAASSHLAPLVTSPVLNSVKEEENPTALNDTISENCTSTTEKQNLSSTTSPRVAEEETSSCDNQVASNVPHHVTRRLRSTSVCIQDSANIQTRGNIGVKRTVVVQSTSGSSQSPHNQSTNKRICVTALSPAAVRVTKVSSPTGSAQNTPKRVFPNGNLRSAS